MSQCPMDTLPSVPNHPGFQEPSEHCPVEIAAQFLCPGTVQKGGFLDKAQGRGSGSHSSFLHRSWQGSSSEIIPALVLKRYELTAQNVWMSRDGAVRNRRDVGAEAVTSS